MITESGRSAARAERSAANTSSRSGSARPSATETRALIVPRSGACVSDIFTICDASGFHGTGTAPVSTSNAITPSA